MSTATYIRTLTLQRPLILDGAMGSMLMPQRPPGISCEQACVDLPEIVTDIHRQYIAAGADIITTNTFCVGALPPTTARRAAHLARQAASESGRRILVAGSIGPETCDYQVIARALIDGGADLLLLETIVDAAQAAEALRAIRRTFPAIPVIPVIASATLAADGRLPSGHTIAEFVAATAPARPLALGLNCGTGPDSLLPHLPALKKLLPPETLLSLHPSAGLPGHILTPTEFATKTAPAKAQILGGCCATTPAHIAALANIENNA